MLPRSWKLSVFNIKENDLIGVYRDVERFEYRDNVGIIQQLTNHNTNERMPAISTTAAVIRKQMGQPNADFSPAAPYVPMLMSILAQSTRIAMPAPTFGITWSPTNMFMTQSPADDNSIQDFTFSPETMTIKASTGVLFDWMDNVYASPVYNCHEMDDAWCERISSIGIE
ncbi:hypothetical protein GJ496_006019 [Pomphorhynchus laevis]|nr:hypothetical protein GJ496_009791 [Pomphorhynchus laevis]KAI0987166.1 hypothetical protein GJ496_002542 [Pomphorhynchus laevis]KAI0987168.1 hypothetical protein GJ496_002544 [Pomphorhynchus laevis]KAI0990492.1 hypothetical protein GJ496_006019 [Pomphorhynchus laevis]